MAFDKDDPKNKEGVDFIRGLVREELSAMVAESKNGKVETEAEKATRLKKENENNGSFFDGLFG